MRMRKFAPVVALAALLAVPAIALGGASAKEGTLSITNGDAATVYMDGRGASVGRVDKVQRIYLLDVVEDDGSGITLTGCDGGSGKEQSTEDGEGSFVFCKGSNIKFKLIGGKFKIRITKAKGLELSVVGRSARSEANPKRVHLEGAGDVDADGDGSFDDGLYSFDGDPYKSLPDKLRKFQLGD
jgi:hypothetical protein